MEQNRSIEHGAAEVLRCHPATHTVLQTAYQQYNMIVATRYILLEFANSKWSTCASTIRTTTIALCYSVAEYAQPIWAISHHAHVLDS